MLSRLLSWARSAPSVSLDGLATLTLPASFHFDDTAEQQLPAARRLRRRPYLDAKALPDRLTYYLARGDYHSWSGFQVFPVLLRITLYADDAPPPLAPDRSYFQHLAAADHQFNVALPCKYDQAQPVTDELYYAEELDTATGWFSTSQYRIQHFVLTDPAQRVRLLLSADERKLGRAEAEHLLRAALRSLRRDPAALAHYFAQTRPVVAHRPEVEQANVEANRRSFNQQLASANLPPLRPVARYAPGQFTDVGTYFYGVNRGQDVFFAARLGSASAALAKVPTYFSNVDSRGRAYPSFVQQAILQQGVPAGRQLLLRTSASMPLWFPPEEFAYFQLADLLRETAESETLVQRNPNFEPPAPTPPVSWDLSGVGESRVAYLGERTDYRFAGLEFEQGVGMGFSLSYLGRRATAGQPPQAVFVLEIFDDGPRHRVAPGAQHLAVDAAQGGEVEITVGGTRCQVRFEPPAQGHLVVALCPTPGSDASPLAAFRQAYFGPAGRYPTARGGYPAGAACLAALSAPERAQAEAELLAALRQRTADARALLGLGDLRSTDALPLLHDFLRQGLATHYVLLVIARITPAGLDRPLLAELLLTATNPEQLLDLLLGLQDSFTLPQVGSAVAAVLRLFTYPDAAVRCQALTTLSQFYGVPALSQDATLRGLLSQAQNPDAYREAQRLFLAHVPAASPALTP